MLSPTLGAIMTAGRVPREVMTPWAALDVLVGPTFKMPPVTLPPMPNGEFGVVFRVEVLDVPVFVVIEPDCTMAPVIVVDVRRPAALVPDASIVPPRFTFPTISVLSEMAIGPEPEIVNLDPAFMEISPVNIPVPSSRMPD